MGGLRASASALASRTIYGKKIGDVHHKVGTAQVQAGASVSQTHVEVGVKASVDAYKLESSHLDANLGLSASTGASFGAEGVKVSMLGFGGGIDKDGISLSTPIGALKIKPFGGKVPYVVKGNFNFTLPSHEIDINGDRVRVVDHGLDTEAADRRGVKIGLHNQADNWWKAITVHEQNHCKSELVHTENDVHYREEIMQPEKILGSQLVLSKGGAFCSHTNVILIQNREHMKLGHKYVFEWITC